MIRYRKPPKIKVDELEEMTPAQRRKAVAKMVKRAREEAIRRRTYEAHGHFDRSKRTAAICNAGPGWYPAARDHLLQGASQ